MGVRIEENFQTWRKVLKKGQSAFLVTPAGEVVEILIEDAEKNRVSVAVKITSKWIAAKGEQPATYILVRETKV